MTANPATAMMSVTTPSASVVVQRCDCEETLPSRPAATSPATRISATLVMALATAINYGRAIGFALFVALCGAIWWKARQEEQIMSRHFPDAYAEYKKRVRAIIPFVL